MLKLMRIIIKWCAYKHVTFSEVKNLYVRRFTHNLHVLKMVMLKNFPQNIFA